MSPHDSVLTPGRNCWRVAHADRAAFLIDAADYYRAFRDVAATAEQSVFILGWDIDSRLTLVRDDQTGGASHRVPPNLGDFLRAIASGRRTIHVYVLIWDFAMIYALEREWLPHYKLEWRGHRRLHIHLDDQHPVGGCHHQKMVVVDDRVAFVGGLDLTRSRWDTPEHRREDPRRVDPSGERYPPFHDVQMMVSGEAARGLGELARERWQKATGRQARRPTKSPSSDPWPDWVRPDAEHVEVGIARTQPAYEGREPVREIERLYRDAIARAQRDIYIENQFLTSTIVGEALGERLKDPQGPEILIVLRLHGGDWLEQFTMDIVRERLLQHLTASDAHGRLGVYYPHCHGMDDECIGLHSKVAVFDDELVRVGSANLTNRSMRLDTECDLAFEARGDEKTRSAIAGFRNRLLGEHLGVKPEVVAKTVLAERSLLKAVERLRGGERTLEPFELGKPSDLNPWVPGAEVVDPERPMAADLVADHFIHPADREPAGRHLVLSVSVIAALLLLAAAWRWTPLGDWLDPQSALAVLEQVKTYPGAPVIVVGGFVLGGLLVAPVTALVVATLAVFGPVEGFVYALTGSILSGLVTFGIGRGLGRSGVRKLVGARMSRLSRHLARRGLVSMVIAHMLPVAPFTLVNMAAGALQFRLRDFVIGTALGMAPGMIALAVLIDRVEATIRTPNAGTLALLGTLTAALVVGAWGVQRVLKRRLARRAPSPDS